MQSHKVLRLGVSLASLRETLSRIPDRLDSFFNVSLRRAEVRDAGA
jgi:hypothetical protein